ncbi:hypothetical protein Misp01_03840 [Microtetraspora sp. NBRC 13810]|uniref:hypothetical protein n=1 Tax=Microtetraspora sp. NBRC 13810 TaxID=3030990 RepID=UPI00249FC1C4|nr:hypothetical protein [Microtetraspora sp. NBRC 13810]GLW05254.1 hypothetical protein Misp01_03840 [Microtetraspora sp. NBRC 13810]
MSPLGKYYVGAAVVAVIALILIPSPIDWLIVVAALGAPVAAYFMLDQSQRERLKRVRRRGIGR